MHALGEGAGVPARIVSDAGIAYRLLGCRAPLGALSGSARESLTGVRRPVVGDWVLVEDDDDRAIIHHALRRRTELSRRAAGTAGTRGEVQIIAANVDVFFVVTSANLDFNVRRLERYLAAVNASGAQIVVVINKVDLAEDLEVLRRDIDAVAPGVDILATSAADGTGLGSLAAYLEPGRTCALIGSSGVGKSSLTNRLLGSEHLAVDGLRNDDKGRHTTTHREIVLLPSGGLLMDTPGMRELGLAGGESDAVDTAFADVDAIAQSCRFRDCQHQSEPGCAVKAAVASGELPAERLASYDKLSTEAIAQARKRLRNHPKRR